MKKKPLPKNTCILEKLFADCSKQLEVNKDLLDRNEIRLGIFETALTTPDDLVKYNGRLDAIINESFRVSADPVPSLHTLLPYLDLVIISKIIEVEREGNKCLEMGYQSLKNSVAKFSATNEAIDLFTKGLKLNIQSQRGKFKVFKELQDKIVKKLKDRKDTSGDTSEILEKFKPPNPETRGCIEYLEANKNSVLSEAALIEKFYDIRSPKITIAGLKKAVYRYKKNLLDHGIDE